MLGMTAPVSDDGSEPTWIAFVPNEYEEEAMGNCGLGRRCEAMASAKQRGFMGTMSKHAICRLCER